GQGTSRRQRRDRRAMRETVTVPRDPSRTLVVGASPDCRESRRERALPAPPRARNAAWGRLRLGRRRGCAGGSAPRRSRLPTRHGAAAGERTAAHASPVARTYGRDGILAGTGAVVRRSAGGCARAAGTPPRRLALRRPPPAD